MQPSIEEYRRTLDISERRRCDVYTSMEYDQAAQVQYYTTIRRFREGEQTVDERRTSIELRYTYPQELQRTLEANAFRLLHRYEGWTESPLLRECGTMVIVCQKA